MKNLLLIAIALITLNATAQEKERKGRKHNRTDFTPEQVATLKTKQMVLELDLTASQQKQIQKINLENAKERELRRDDFKKSKDVVKDRSSEERFKLKNERLDKALAHKSEMKKILNKEQYERWEKGKHRKGMKKRRYAKSRKMMTKRKRMHEDKKGK